MVLGLPEIEDVGRAAQAVIDVLAEVVGETLVLAVKSVATASKAAFKDNEVEVITGATVLLIGYVTFLSLRNAAAPKFVK